MYYRVKDVIHIDKLVDIAMTTEVIASTIHVIHEAYRIKETDVLSISFIDTIFKHPRWSSAARSCACTDMF